MGSNTLLMSEFTNSLSSAAALVDSLYNCRGAREMSVLTYSGEFLLGSASDLLVSAVVQDELTP